MEGNIESYQGDLDEKSKRFEYLKRFFKSDMRIKEELLKLAPTELDDYNEESRREYTDKLYTALRDLEEEFVQMVYNILGENTNVVQAVRMHFAQAKEAFLIGNYNSGIIQNLYRNQFTSMTPKLVEDVKSQFVGHTLWRGNLEELVNESTSVNELLHVMHSYVINNENLLQSLPIVDTKNNAGHYPITLYGQETELSRKLFKGIPEDLDVGCTEIVSIPNKILMMVRDRGHALTIDIDTAKEDDIGVKYFVPKICNDKMVAELPGINASSISPNGATGFFVTKKEEMTEKLVDFIGRVPTDLDMEPYDREEIIKMVRAGNFIKGTSQPTQEETSDEQEKIFDEDDAKELAMTTGEKGNRIGMINYVKNALSHAKEKLKNIFRGDINYDRTNRD